MAFKILMQQKNRLRQQRHLLRFIKTPGAHLLPDAVLPHSQTLVWEWNNQGSFASL